MSEKEATMEPDVTVTVKEVNGKRKIVCQPHKVKVTEEDTTLTFALATDGYVFPPNCAVVVHHPGSQFPTAPVTEPGGKTVNLYDVCTEAGDFNYTVFVVNESGTERLAEDPSIQNEP